MYNDASGWLATQLSITACKHFAVVCRTNGAMEIFAVPDMTRVWASDDVADLPLILAARDDVSSASAGTILMSAYLAPCLPPLASLHELQTG